MCANKKRSKIPELSPMHCCKMCHSALCHIQLKDVQCLIYLRHSTTKSFQFAPSNYFIRYRDLMSEGLFKTLGRKKHPSCSGVFPTRQTRNLMKVCRTLKKTLAPCALRNTVWDPPVSLLFICQVSIQDLLDIQLPRPYDVEMPKVPWRSAISHWHVKTWPNE